MQGASVSRATARECWAADRERYGRGAWVREPTLCAVAAYRLSQHMAEIRTPAPLFAVVRLLSRWIQVLVGVEIPYQARFGPGLKVFHGGAVVIHADTVAGAHCTLRQGVTIGERRSGGGVPVFGDQVDVGAHGQILGPVRVGDRARIGALALVLDDVPDDGFAVAPRATVRPLRSEGVHPPQT